jgi:hypothetical protein
MQSKLTVLATVAMVMLTTVQVNAATVLDDQFTDGERDTQNLPGSAAWFEGGNALAVVGNELEFQCKTGNAYGHLIGYYAATPITLAEGESIVASVDFSVNYEPADIDRALRVSLYNAGGSKVTADGGSSDAIYTNYRGYEFGVNNGNTAAGGASFRERTGANSILFSSGATSTLGSGVGVDLAADTSYNLTIALTRTASGIDMDVTYAGVTYTTVSDTSNIVDAFDTLAIFNGGDGADASSRMYLDRVTVDVVPEPATMSLLGLGGLALIRRRRR